jgi:hypothetical protein
VKTFNITTGWEYKDYLSFINKQSPGTNSKWNDIHGVNSDVADYNVILQKPTDNRSRGIHFRREPEFLHAWSDPKDPLASYDYSSVDKFHACTWWLTDTYDDLYDLKYNKVNTISVVASSKHKHRANYIRTVSKLNNNIQVKGSIAGARISMQERGMILKDSTMSICIENCAQENYFTEKITDCLLAWTLPLYWGCPNIENFFPEGSYRLINLNEPTELEDIINTPVTSSEIDAIEVARKLILDKYNIWECINKTISIDI